MLLSFRIFPCESKIKHLSFYWAARKYWLLAFTFLRASGPRITRVVPPLGLPRIAADYARLPRITWTTPVYSGLLRFTLDYFGLLQITYVYSGLLVRTRVVSSSWLPRIVVNYARLLRTTPDNQSESPSGPVDYQSCFLLRITANCCALR